MRGIEAIANAGSSMTRIPQDGCAILSRYGLDPGMRWDDESLDD
jgi:hypothetical protein